MDGVIAYFTAKDIPGKNAFVNSACKYSQALSKDEPVRFSNIVYFYNYYYYYFFIIIKYKYISAIKIIKKKRYYQHYNCIHSKAIS